MSVLIAFLLISEMQGRGRARSAEHPSILERPQTVAAILPCQASQHTGELYKDMHFTDMKTGSRNLEACLWSVRTRAGTESQMWLAHIGIFIEWLSWGKGERTKKPEGTVYAGAGVRWAPRCPQCLITGAGSCGGTSGKEQGTVLLHTAVACSVSRKTHSVLPES